VRQYGRIETAIWQNPKFRSLSDEAQRLYLYLIACPHGNLVGCFVLHDGYMMADLNWDQNRVRKHVSELVSKGMIERDETTFVTRILGWWGHNSIDNSKSALGAMRVLLSLPKCRVRDEAYQSLIGIGNKYVDEYRDQYASVFAFSSEPPEPDQEPDQEMEMDKGARAPDPVAMAFDEWNALAKETGLPAVQNRDDTRRRRLKARLKDCGGIEGWRQALRKIRGSPYLLGKVKDWRADFDFVVRPDKFSKIMEGGFDDHKKTGGWADLARAADDWSLADETGLPSDQQLIS